MWSIGIFAGESPYQLQSAPGVLNPVLTRDHVTDVPARFVADPFMVRNGDSWFMFFEVMNRETRKGEIGLATSDDGFVWHYQKIVLVEPFHLSYPYVFAWDDEYYMIPEAWELKAIRLYRADPFPNRWSPVTSLVDAPCADSSIFRFQGRWWMFTCSRPFRHDALRLYYADKLTGPWFAHANNPLIEGNKQTARPAGRVLVCGDGIVRFAQDCVIRYGNQVRAFSVSELTPSTYAEREHDLSPILKGTADWNELGMHHIDPHRIADRSWLACVDGLSAVE
jgi:beta-xylosidase